MRKVNKKELEKLIRENNKFKSLIDREIIEYIKDIKRNFVLPLLNKFPVMFYNQGSHSSWNYSHNHISQHNELEEIEIDFSDEKLSFDSQQEVWEYLISGGKVYSISSEKEKEAKHFYFHKGIMTYSINNISCEHVDFPIYKDIRKYIEPEKKKWYEEIPKQGILCWAYHYNEKHLAVVIIVTKYIKENNLSFISNNGNYPYAIPLTQEEVEQYIYKENKDYCEKD